MARSLNKVQIIGNLGADPEIKYSANGTAMANLKVATSDSRKNKEGEWEERTEWHRVLLLGRNAENAKDYLHKGSKVYIEGKIETRSWDDQNGQKHYMTEIIGNDMMFLDAKDKSAPDNHEPAQQPARRPSGGSSPRPQAPAPKFPAEEDDLPF